MDVRFNPDKIRQAGDEYGRRTTAIVRRAKTAAASVGTMELPALLSDQQREINQILGRLPHSMTFLAEMASDFQRKMARSADAYEQTEAEQTARAESIRRTGSP